MACWAWQSPDELGQRGARCGASDTPPQETTGQTLQCERNRAFSDKYSLSRGSPGFLPAVTYTAQLTRRPRVAPENHALCTMCVNTGSSGWVISSRPRWQQNRGTLSPRLRHSHGHLGEGLPVTSSFGKNTWPTGAPV